MQFNRLLSVIRELENKVVQQQTQKLQELGPASIAAKGAVSPMHDEPSIGPMEETNLDFEALVLGKKQSPNIQSPNILSNPSPAMTGFQPRPTQSTLTPSGLAPSGLNPAGYHSSPTSPLPYMTPMQPTSQTPPPQSSTFFTPLQPTQFTASTNMSSSFQNTQAPRNGFATPTSYPGTTWPSTPQSAPPGGFNGNTWPSNPATTAFPTIAPPPAKTTASLDPNKSNGGNSLDKYQSLL
jgi:hypothetical protein